MASLWLTFMWSLMLIPSLIVNALEVAKRPPSIRVLKAEEIGDSYSVVKWDSPASSFQFVYEITYAKVNDSEKHLFHVPSTQSAALLRNLKPNASYTAAIAASNDCARSEQLSIQFNTLPTTLHPAITHVMPHEIFLTAVVLAMWMFILRHFFVIYSRVTLVNPLSYGQYTPKNRSPTGKASRASTTSTVSKNSRRSIRERSTSGLANGEQKFSLLEDAVHAWRSETVLAKVELVDGMDVTRHFELDRVSVKSDFKENKPLQPSNDRTSISSTNEATQRRARFFETHRNRTVIDPSQSSPLRKISVFSSPPVNFQISSFECSVCTPTTAEQQPTFENAGSCGIPNSSPKEAPFARKISEVLLGKATRDIRRRSSYGMPAERLTRFKAARSRLTERRRSLFSSLKWKSMRSRHRRQKKMEIVKELEETRETSPEYENTYSQRPLLLSVALQKNQISLDSQESYATAREVVSINIDTPDS